MEDYQFKKIEAFNNYVVKDNNGKVWYRGSHSNRSSPQYNALNLGEFLEDPLQNVSILSPIPNTLISYNETSREITANVGDWSETIITGSVIKGTANTPFLGGQEGWFVRVDNETVGGTIGAASILVSTDGNIYITPKAAGEVTITGDLSVTGSIGGSTTISGTTYNSWTVNTDASGTDTSKLILNTNFATDSYMQNDKDGNLIISAAGTTFTFERDSNTYTLPIASSGILATETYVNLQIAAYTHPLGDLSDVDLTGLLDDDLITYDLTSGNWIVKRNTEVGRTDHGTLDGLGDDDHTQYHNDTRALAWLGTRSIVDTGDGFTTNEKNQLLNINTTTISVDQWAWLGGTTLSSGKPIASDIAFDPSGMTLISPTSIDVDLALTDLDTEAANAVIVTEAVVTETFRDQYNFTVITNQTNPQITLQNNKLLGYNFFMKAGEIFQLADATITLTGGTLLNPQENWIVAKDTAGTAYWDVITTEPISTDDLVLAAKVIVGGTANNWFFYSVEDRTAFGHELERRLHHRAYVRGSFWEDGFAFSVDVSNYMQCDAGNASVQNHFTSGNAKDTSVTDVVYYTDNAGDFYNFDNLDDLTTYIDGSAIGSNKYYNVIVFYVLAEDDSVGQLWATSQDKPSPEYTSYDAALNDDHQVVHWSLDDRMRPNSVIIARIILQKLVTGSTVVDVIDLRSSGGLGGGGGGVAPTDHGALVGLGDDDHLQYFLVTGARAVTGTLKTDYIEEATVGKGIHTETHFEFHKDLPAFGATDLYFFTDFFLTNENATGGFVTAIHASKVGDGLNRTYALTATTEVGLIFQHVGSEVDPNYVYKYSTGYTDITAEAISKVSNITIFDNQNDYLYIGKTNSYGEIKFLLINAFIDSIIPIFEFWSGAAWQTFVPEDSSNGFLESGIISWDTEALETAGWVANTVNTTSAFWIRIQRTLAGVVTPATEKRFWVAKVVDRYWNENAELNIDSITSTEHVDFDTSASPTWKEGRIYYHNVDKALAYYNDEADMSLQIGQEMVARVYNDTGSTILNGKAVYIVGANASAPKIALAKADAESTARVVGLATHNIETATYGYITHIGRVKDLNTAAWVPGTSLYLSDTVAGDLTTTPPGTGSFIKEVCTVIKSDASVGQVLVEIGSGLRIQLGTSNQLLGVDNAGVKQEYKTLSGTANQITVTHGSGTVTLSAPQDLGIGSDVTFKSITIDNQGAGADPILQSISASQQLSLTGEFKVSLDYKWLSGTGSDGVLAHANTSARTYTFPDATITVAGINLAQTWSASQNFNTTLNKFTFAGDVEVKIDSDGGTNNDSILSFHEATVDRGDIRWDGTNNKFIWASSAGDIELVPTGNVVFTPGGTSQFNGSITVINQGAGTDPLIYSNDAAQILGITGWLNVSQDIQWKSGTSYNGALAHANTAIRTYTFPDASMTVAGVDLAQTWTAIQSFGSGIMLFDFTGQDYVVKERSNSICVEGQTTATYVGLELYTNDGDGTDDVWFMPVWKGSTTDLINSEYAKIGWDASESEFSISTVETGTGTLRPINIYTTGNIDQLLLAIDGTVSTSGNFSTTATAININNSSAVNRAFQIDSYNVIMRDASHNVIVNQSATSPLYLYGNNNVYIGRASDADAITSRGSHTFSYNVAVNGVTIMGANATGLNGQVEIGCTADRVGLTIQGHSTQATDLFRLQDSAGALLASWDKDGYIDSYSGTTSITDGYGFIWSVGNQRFEIGYVGAGSGDNLGNHTATQDLNMAGFDIDGANDIYQNANDDLLGLYGGTAYNSGASVTLNGETRATNPGDATITFGGTPGTGNLASEFIVRYRNDSNVLSNLLTVYPSGNLLLDVYNAIGDGGGIFFRSGFVASDIYNLSITIYDDGDAAPDSLSINAYDGIYFNTGSNTKNIRGYFADSGTFHVLVGLDMNGASIINVNSCTIADEGDNEGYMGPSNTWGFHHPSTAQGGYDAVEITIDDPFQIRDGSGNELAEVDTDGKLSCNEEVNIRDTSAGDKWQIAYNSVTESLDFNYTG